MGFKRKRNYMESRRYAKRSTKRRLTLRPPTHPGRIVAIVVAAVAVIVLALVWGSSLKRKSDAYRDAESRGEWMLDTSIASPILQDIPESYRAVAIPPEGNVGDILIAGNHGGILLPLCDDEGAPLFTSAVAREAGLAVAEDAPDLPDEVYRITRRGLRLTCTFTVTFPSVSDPSVRMYRRGLELALLSEWAAAGADDLLILGLPAGTDELDRLSVDFLNDLNAGLATLSDPPAVGVALPLAAFESDEPVGATTPIEGSTEDTSENDAPLYAGNISPARLCASASYLALDLRGRDTAAVEELLPHLSYTYLRHSLYLITDMATPATTKAVLSHGFLRVMEG